MPLTVELGKLRIVVTAPDFKLTLEQETAIEQWWQRQIDRLVENEFRHVVRLPDEEAELRKRGLGALWKY